MVVLVGTMQLPAPENPDPSDDYFNGTISGGGLWTALTRTSDHDHTGGTNGKPISVSSIPDGSITTAKLDPSVLLPYALVDGSKAFTGLVAMNANAIVRNTLYFGAQPAGAADVTLARTGVGALRLDTNLGVGVAPAAWRSDVRVVQLGQAGALVAGNASPYTQVSDNTYNDGTKATPLVGSQPASILQVSGGGMSVATAPGVALAGSQAFTTRLTLDNAGNLGVGVTPPALGATYRGLFIGQQGGLTSTVSGSGTSLVDNSYYNGTNNVAITPGLASSLGLGSGQITFYTAPSVGAGATQTFIQRFGIDGNGSTVIGLPNANTQSALIVNPSMTLASASVMSPVHFTPGMTRTAGSGSDMYGLYNGPVATVNAGVSMANVFSALFALTLQNSGTISNASTLYLSNPTANGTISSRFAIYHGDTGANLSVTGAWNPASREFNDDGTPFKLRRGLLADRLDALATVCALPLRVYTYAADGDPDTAKEYAGFFAEELRESSPLLSDGTSPHMVGVDALAMRAIQQLEARVAALEGRVP